MTETSESWEDWRKNSARSYEILLKLSFKFSAEHFRFAGKPSLHCKKSNSPLSPNWCLINSNLLSPGILVWLGQQEVVKAEIFRPFSSGASPSPGKEGCFSPLPPVWIFFFFAHLAHFCFPWSASKISLCFILLNRVCYRFDIISHHCRCLHLFIHILLHLRNISLSFIKSIIFIHTNWRSVAGKTHLLHHHIVVRNKYVPPTHVYKMTKILRAFGLVTKLSFIAPINP